MEFNVNKNDLIEPVLLASNVSEKRQSIPILSNVLISAAKNSIKITATDLEIEFKITIEDVEVKKEGEVTVSARKLADLVRSIPEDTKLNFCLIDNQIEIKALKFQADLATLPASDFPSIDAVDYSSSRYDRLNFSSNGCSRCKILFKRLLARNKRKRIMRGIN